MYEIFFYAGIVVSGACFLLAVFLFFFLNVPAAVRYYLRMGGKKTRQSKSYEGVSDTSKKSKKKEKKSKLSPAPVLTVANEGTELLDIAQNYATALLDADNTVLLPDLNESK